MTTPEIFFYINFGLIFVALIDAAGVFALARKTACRRVAAIVAGALFGVAFAIYVAQLALYSSGHALSAQFVYAATGTLGGAIVGAAVYCFLLCVRSNKGLCVATGALQFVPPIGAFLMIALAIKLRRDTSVQKFVYTGYAFTYAAYGAFVRRYAADFTDGSDTVEYEPLAPKAVKAKLKAAKKAATDPDGMYRYGVLVAQYRAKKIKTAFKYFAKAAKHDHAAALYNLGYCHEMGLYVSRDLKKAAEQYRRASALGDADATLRLGITEIKLGNPQKGIEIFKAESERGSICAEFDYALCVERGIGVEKNMQDALKRIFKCADLGLFAAQSHVLELASKTLNVPELDGLFALIDKHSFVGALDNIVKATAAVRDKRARDASRLFLSAVRLRDRWEGVARLFVGTLYLDSGEKPADKRNGAEYVKSAIGMTPIAKDIYATVPKEYKK